jgi:hypothetical protein
MTCRIEKLWGNCGGTLPHGMEEPLLGPEGLLHCPLRGLGGKVAVLVGHSDGRVPQCLRYSLLRDTVH